MKMVTNLMMGLPVAALLAFAPLTAQAQWYVGADAGVNFLGKESLDGTNSDGEAFSDKSGSKTGYAVQFQGGYDFGGPKAELEIGYRGSKLKSLAEVTDDTVSGATTSLSIMANGIYQFMPQSSWHPFVGAGIGMARIGADWDVGGQKAVNDADWVFAYQGLAGIAYDIDKNWGAKLEYSYFATQDAKLTDVDGGSVNLGYHAHSVLAGMTYKFSK